MYRTCSHTSPCVKMLAPRAYSTTLFATPDESRNACALKGARREDLAGFATPGVRAVDDLMPTTVCPLYRGPMFRIEQRDDCGQRCLQVCAMAQRSDAGRYRTRKSKTRANMVLCPRPV